MIYENEAQNLRRCKNGAERPKKSKKRKASIYLTKATISATKTRHK